MALLGSSGNFGFSGGTLCYRGSLIFFFFFFKAPGAQSFVNRSIYSKCLALEVGELILLGKGLLPFLGFLFSFCIFLLLRISLQKHFRIIISILKVGV